MFMKKISTKFIFLKIIKKYNNFPKYWFSQVALLEINCPYFSKITWNEIRLN